MFLLPKISLHTRQDIGERVLCARTLRVCGEDMPKHGWNVVVVWQVFGAATHFCDISEGVA